jgi:hypothetical protein
LLAGIDDVSPVCAKTDMLVIAANKIAIYFFIFFSLI